MNKNNRAVAIRFGLVRLAVHAQERYTLGGACSPIKILKFRGYEIASETTYRPKDGVGFSAATLRR